MDEKSSIILGVITGSALMVVLVLVIVIFVVQAIKRLERKENEHTISLKNKELEQLRAVIEAQESEREKLAVNLHDEVGTLLSTLKLNVSRHKRSLSKNKLTEEAEDKHKHIMIIIAKAETRHKKQ